MADLHTPPPAGRKAGPFVPESGARKGSPLDRDMVRELDQAQVPEASLLSAGTLHAHDPAIERETQALAALDPAEDRIAHRIYQALSVLAALAVIAVLLVMVLDLPRFGQASNPVNNEVSARYLASGLQEGGATNLVADMILDYRAFDTLGESNVLFAAACTVILLLRRLADAEDRRLPASGGAFAVPADPVLRAAARLMVPAILLFGVYIVLNGHLSPGGGFSGGAVMGAGLILYLNAFGPEAASRFFSYRIFRRFSACALGFYALSKAWSFFTGANGLESGIPSGIPGSILSGGLILPLNIAVGCVVCCTMYAFFSLFQRGEV